MRKKNVEVGNVVEKSVEGLTRREVALEVADIADRISSLVDRMWKEGNGTPPLYMKLRVVDYIVKAIDPLGEL